MDQADPDALRRVFVAETSDHLDDLEGALMELEAHPEDRELLQQVFRIAHTIKGSAGSLGFFALADLGHSIEDLLAALGAQSARVTPPVCDLLLESADAARQMLPDVLAGIDRLHPSAESLLQRLGARGQDTPPRAPRTAALEVLPKETAPAPPARGQTVRVDVAKLDRMVDLMGEIAVGRGRIVERLRAESGAAAAALREEMEQSERLYAELAEAIRTARMVPIGPWLKRYTRQIRDVARAHGKVARLAVEGSEVEVDMAVIERLSDPLTHLIRNAIDHGIERPDIRRARGKSPAGTITLAAFYEGGGISLRITDDGAGLSRERIAEEARARGIAADPAALSTRDLERLVFEPGFSTAPAVSDLSGRGMGLPVVRQHIEALRGSIRIESADGLFTSFTLRLPLTLATIDGLSVAAGGEVFVIPIEAVVECVEAPSGGRNAAHGDMMNLRGRAMPCARLRDIYDLEGPASARESVVVVTHEGGVAGLVVDALHGEGRTVIKPLGQLFSGIPGIAGGAILGDGRVALILDVTSLLRKLGGSSMQRGTQSESPRR